MFNFLVGLAIGWLAGSWYANGNGRTSLPVEQLRRKATSALEESERLVEESKRELQAALSGDSGKGESTRGGERPRRARRPRGRPNDGKSEND